MQHTDIAIVGGGLAGSMAAAMLGRADHDVILIDPHAVYPKDFRCEKLDALQLELLRKTGLNGAVAGASTVDQRIWIARFGHIVEKRPCGQLNILYDNMVNTVRGAIPANVSVVHGKAASIATSDDRQHVRLANGEEISARLVVLANGLNLALRLQVGINRKVISPCHSISIGFDVKPVSRTRFDFESLTYHSENPASRVAYLALFPIGAAIRANLFVYTDAHDPWLSQLRQDPKAGLFAAMPRLRPLTGEVEVSNLKIRPVDLYVSESHLQPGIVLVGDAFATSCPAAGTGCSKVFTDVERLCNIHVPRWLATPGMARDKVESFYDDPVKTACDASSAEKAFRARTFATAAAPAWRARRAAKFAAHLGIGAAREGWERLSAALSAPERAPEVRAPSESGRWA
jgi:2-polyprenyl-6-methoxyphenol hydroxylase-like FAD-dependent oxidoreductase